MSDQPGTAGHEGAGAGAAPSTAITCLAVSALAYSGASNAAVTPPLLAPARGPPQHDRAFDAGHGLDRTPAFDPADSEPVPDRDFDPSRGA